MRIISYRVRRWIGCPYRWVQRCIERRLDQWFWRHWFMNKETAIEHRVRALEQKDKALFDFSVGRLSGLERDARRMELRVADLEKQHPKRGLEFGRDR